MSDRQSAVLEHLSDDEPVTTDDLVELTGLERSAVSLELAALKHAGRVHPGRGGWRLTATTAPKVKRHEAGEADVVVTRRTKDRERKAKKRDKPAPRRAPAGEVERDALPAIAGAAYLFGITEAGELTVTDRKDAAKSVRFSAHDTARLALLLKRWGTLIPALLDKGAA